MAFSSSGLVDCCSLEPIVWDTLPRKQGGRIVDRIQRVSLLSKVWFWAACSGRHGMPWNPYKTKSNVNAVKINYLIFYQMEEEDGWKLWNSYYDVFLKEMVQSLSCGHLKKKKKVNFTSENYNHYNKLSKLLTLTTALCKQPLDSNVLATQWWIPSNTLGQFFLAQLQNLAESGCLPSSAPNLKKKKGENSNNF